MRKTVCFIPNPANSACLISFACVFPCQTGLPIISQSFNYSDPKWYMVAGTIARLAEFVQLAATIAGSHYFYPLIVCSLENWKDWRKIPSAPVGGELLLKNDDNQLRI